MFKKPVPKDSALDTAIASALNDLAKFEVDSKEYARALAAVSKLYKLKQLDKPEHVSKDTLAIVVGNILGILLIVSHERAHVVTSKALHFLGRVR
jgi:hypothetical protein